ncbi:efflux RND transporter periplasmic adaptor subunit [Rhodosalinus sediminis]|uniref:efflux RND transporter periplasmic adaptor subunit n=1 Tax=Rhodosalinus sediminis TaxID=1940533 RepID=UPI0023539D99|nr:HlyD family efflux transporter periplasmic adaptor subunit [Rhodosalinus sediminis]
MGRPHAGRHIAAAALIALCAPAAAAQPLSDGRAIIDPVEQATLSAELAGVILDMPVRPGARFREGDVLVRLDCRLFEAQADRAFAERDIAALRAENAAELERRASIGRVEADVAAREHAKRAAEARVARLNAERCTIRAPFTGRVAAWEAHPHERAEQGMPILRIVGTERFEAEIVAGADWIGRVAPGDPVAIALDQRPVTLRAAVRALTPEMDPVSQTVTVYAEIATPEGLSGGMTGTATALQSPQVAAD